MNTKRDYRTLDMFENGVYENEDTPIEIINEPKLLIHKRNEIPLFLVPDSSQAAVKSVWTNGINEVFVPLQVQYSNKTRIQKKSIILINSIFFS